MKYLNKLSLYKYSCAFYWHNTNTTYLLHTGVFQCEPNFTILACASPNCYSCTTAGQCQKCQPYYTENTAFTACTRKYIYVQKYHTESMHILPILRGKFCVYMQIYICTCFVLLFTRVMIKYDFSMK